MNLRNTMGWDKYLKPFLYKELPPTTGWSAILGTLCALTFIIMAITGMVLGIGFTMLYIIQCTPAFMGMKPWLLGIDATGIGTVGMVINFTVTILVSLFTAAPPAAVQQMVESVRIPRGAGAAVDH